MLEVSDSKFNQLCELAEEIVEKTGYILSKSLDKYKDHALEVPSILSIRQMYEFGDGATILIKLNSNDSAVSVIRSLFEVEVGMEYLIQKNQEDRAYKFLFFYNKKKKIELSKSSPGTEEYNRTLEILKRDKNNVKEEIINEFKNSSINEEFHKALDHVLKFKKFNELNKYYDRVHYKKKQYWYSLLDGPENLRLLLEELDMPSQYHINYNLWSSIAHGWDIINRHLIFEENYANVISKRNPSGFKNNAMNIITILRRGLLLYTTSKLPEIIPEMNTWITNFNRRFSEACRD